MACIQCGSHAINLNTNGRDANLPNLCDVCYWKDRAHHAQRHSAALQVLNDRLIHNLRGFVEDCMVTWDTHTVPKNVQFDKDNRDHRLQLVGSMSVCYERIYNAAEALKAQPAFVLEEPDC